MGCREAKSSALARKRRRFERSRACQGASLKERQKEMTLFDQFATEGNEKADELEDVAMLDGGDMAQIRASTVQQKRE